MVIEDRQLKVYADNSGGTESHPDAMRATQTKAAAGTKRHGDLIKVVTIPDEVVPEKLICVVRDGELQVRETKSSNKKPGGLPGQRASLGDSIALQGSLPLRPNTPESTHAQGSGTTPGADRSHQDPMVIHDDGSLQLKLILRIPPGYNMQDLVIKTIDDQLIVTGKKFDPLLMSPAPPETEPASLSVPAKSSDSPPSLENEFVKVFELPNTVDPYSITAHVTERCQLVIQAMLSSRGRCGSY